MITDINPVLLIDGYKADHRRQYPEGTEYVYSNLTPRMSRVKGVDFIIWWGLQYFLKSYLIEYWNRRFFSQPKWMVIADYVRTMKRYIGNEAVSYEHIEELHDLGYLPIRIKALPEGSKVPIGVPVLTIINTQKKFFWITNYLETLLSNILWKPTTSATTAYLFRREFERHAEKTGYNKEFIDWQCHDFSFRGTSGLEDAMMCDGGHLTSFTGTDTIPTLSFMEQFYRADIDKEMVGASVPATEHSVMCMGTQEDEIGTIRRLIHDLYPTGVVSIVIDTWDFWKVMTVYIPLLKEEIMARDGRVVFRPDSGDPVDIICGTGENYHTESDFVLTTKELKKGQSYQNALEEMLEEACYDFGTGLYTGKGDLPDGGYETTVYGKFNGELQEIKLKCNVEWVGDWSVRANLPSSIEVLSIKKLQQTPEMRGAYEVLYDIFGGTVNDRGYKELHPSVGLIYGDSITRQRQIEILKKLEDKGFAASNIVLGIGSFTYEYTTRDTFGFAMKATWGQVKDQPRDIFKNPKTDSGFKKSAKGLLYVYEENGKLMLKDQCTMGMENGGLLKEVFLNGKITKTVTLEEVRARIKSHCE